MNRGFLLPVFAAAIGTLRLFAQDASGDGLPAPVFLAPLAGSAVAETTSGPVSPLEESGIAWAEGRLGSPALRAAAGLRLAYPAAGILPGDSGTVAAWTKREWRPGDDSRWRTVFATPMPGGRGKERVGSGALWFWWWGTRIRADQSDARDRYRAWDGLPADSEWHHVAFTWTPARVEIFVDGVCRTGIRDNASPMRDALDEAAAVAPDRSGTDRFFVGQLDGEEAADSLISDFRIYGSALSPDQIRELFSGTGGSDAPEIHPDWGAIAAAHAGKHERAALPGEAPGTLAAEALVEVDAIDPVAVSSDPERFSSVGPCRAAGGSLEAGPSKGDRFALRLRLDPDSPLHVIDVDVPDDAVRTMDLIVQPCKGDADYAMQVGLMLGGEYPASGGVVTHRCLLWNRSPDVAVVAMTARAGEPAAVSAVRAFAVRGARLPVAAPPDGIPPSGDPARARHVAAYYEDPAVNLEFGLSPRAASTPEGFAEELSRLAATMKFTGEDTLFYPAAWYQGLLGGAYDPRGHAPYFRAGMYEAFDLEGLGFVPTVNMNNMPVAPGLVTVSSMDDGSLHGTAIAIHSDGRPNPGRWHNTPPNFNVFHPDVQRHVENVFDAIVAEGAPHPSFRGVCLHLTKHCLAWWGDEESGYNDYAVAAFCRDSGRRLPPEIDRSAPLRGKAYAEWLRSDPDLREAWIQWRCDRVTEFYARLAAKLAAARPGAKLFINSFVPADVNHPDFLRGGYMERANRACGLDAPALSAAIPNLVLMQTSVPADFRWAEVWRYKGDAARVAAARAKQRDMDSEADFWSLHDSATFPWANQHDRYCESAIGADGGSLSRAWLSECRWRVSTLNPAGENALRHFALPLRFHDVLGFSKGGFLVGTYGMEEKLAPMALALRALPPVVLPELPGSTDVVKVRGGDWEGRRYVYAANTGAEPAETVLPLPAGAVDLAGCEAPGPDGRIALPPYSLRAFAAPVPAGPDR